MRSQHCQQMLLNLAAYKAVLLASGNTTLQLDSEIVVGSTFEVTSATDLKLITLGYGTAEATGVDNSAALPAGDTYIVTTLPAGGQVDYGEGDQVAGLLRADSSSYLRYDGSDPGNDDMELGDVLVLNAEVITGDLDGTIELKKVNSGDSAFVAGQTYEIATMGSSDGAITDAGLKRCIGNSACCYR